ncbi:MAG: RagB/SusD family nutrient uptake outer membrane protein, partial [Chitinophagales bacterium]
MKTLNKIFIITIAAITFSSCKNFLDIKSPNDVSDQDVFTDANSLLSARIGLYNTLQNEFYYGGYFPLMIDGYSDNGAAGGYSDPDLNQFNYKALSADNGLVASLWVAIYNTIYTANQIIVGADQITDPALTDDVRNDVKGEALCIRALAHFDLLRTFGEHWDLNSKYGIPLVLKVATPQDIFPRNTVQECYTAIEADLQQALILVSNDDVEYLTGPKTAGFVTQYFVQGLLARLYLYEK